MSCCNNHKDDPCYRSALNRIKNSPKPTFCAGPTGPTGPTHTLISESKIYFYRHFFNIMA